MFIVYLDDEIIHSPYPNAVKIASGKITQRQITHSFRFEVNRGTYAWDNFRPFLSEIKVFISETGEKIFHGRAMTPIQTMDASGKARTQFIAEDRTAYLNDTAQVAYYQEGNSIRAFMQQVITVHNAMLPNSPEKHFKVGNITVEDFNEEMEKYIDDGDNTMDVVKKKLIDQLGGYILLREETDGLYIDYLSTVGEVTQTRFILGRNIKTYSREIDPSEVKTIIMPLGAEIELPDDASEESLKEMGVKRVNISSVNDGSLVIEHEGLIEEFGEHVRPVVFDDVKDPTVLKQKGEDYAQSQIAAMLNYKITPLDLSLKKGEEYEAFGAIELYNWYQIYMPIFDSYETLQVIQKDIDIINFMTSSIQVASREVTLSEYRRVMRKSTAKIEDVITYQGRLHKLANRKIKKITDDLTSVVDELATVQGDLVSFNSDLTGAIGDINSLATQLGQITTMYNDLNQAQTGLKPRTNSLEQSRTIHNTAIYGDNGILARLNAAGI